jgi:hypothetical protein
MTRTRHVWNRLARAWPVTIGLHVFQCLFAASFALPFVQSVSVPGSLLRPRVAEWVGFLRIADGFEHGTSARALLPLALAALNYPWLSVAWVHALSEEAPFAEHARFALGRYRAAIGVASSAAVSLLALVLATVFITQGVGRWLATSDDRTVDLVRLAGLIPGLLAAVWIVTAQDLGYAAISGGATGFREILTDAARRATPRLALERVGLIAAQIVLTVTAWGIPRLGLGPGTAADFVVLVATQTVTFIITCARATWLAWILERSLER